MKRPKKKKLDERFKWTWQYALAKKYNQACDEWEKYHKEEIKKLKELIDDLSKGRQGY